MIEKQQDGRYVLRYETCGIIRRIPIERRGVSKRGNEWVRGGVLLEVAEDGCEGSAQLFLTTWQEEMIETINRIGVGKNIKVKFHIECREYYDNYQCNILLDDIQMSTEGENFLIGKKQ